MNFPVPMLALLAAARQGDSASDSGRVALLAMMIRPPMMGLLVATFLAKQTARLLNEPVVRRALQGLTRKDAQRMRQLEDAVWELHRAVDDVRDRLAFNGPARRKTKLTSKKKASKPGRSRSLKRVRAAGPKTRNP